jgi:hypothetical protein
MTVKAESQLVNVGFVFFFHTVHFLLTDMETRMDILYLLLLILTTVAAMRPEGKLEVIQATASDTSYRLPKTVRPISYDVYLKPEFKTFTFEGAVNIRVEVLKDTNEIILHSNKQTISLVTVSDSDSVIVNTTEANIDSVKHFLIINSTSEFLASTQYDIDITFQATLSEDMSGFYRSSYSFGDKIR